MRLFLEVKMVFSSISFIYYFLPLVLILYFIVPKKFKNICLLTFSLFFYFYGEGKFLWVLLLSCIMNFIYGLLIEKYRDKKASRYILFIAIISNIGMLMYFKYINFFIDNINNIFRINIPFIQVIMPIGISFFTFQTLSYVIDVYNGKVKASKNVIDFCTYVTLFFQLIAGPIVRYVDVERELKYRKCNIDEFAEGVTRFIVGLAKKVLIANELGSLISSLYDIPEMTVLSYFIIAINQTLQLYFDFSGYSDIAIGLGKMFGFHFLENFNYPFIARSITDFWRRWHISLSSFFRDYVYIPLGGNKGSVLKHIRNIFIVWLLTGFWHGAGWNFILWGLYFAILLTIEKYFLKSFLDKHKIFGHVYTIILVLISFIIFNANNLKEGLIFIKSLFCLNKLPIYNFSTIYYIKSYLVILIVGIICSTPIIKFIKKFFKNKKFYVLGNALEVCFTIILLIAVTASLIDASFNPFLYFRF